MLSEKKKERYLAKIKNDGVYQPGLHPLQILVDLDEKEHNQYSIAAEIGKSQPAVSQVINRKTRSVTIAKQISETLCVSFLETWGMTEEEYVSKKRT